jgi:hypothetical protein
MIAYGAQHAAGQARLSRDLAPRHPASTSAIAPASAEPKPTPRQPRLTRAQFIAREVSESRMIVTLPTEDGLGVTRWDRRYVALPCHVDHDQNPGWVLVHDEPGARNHYERLFGRGDTPALPSMPGPVRSADA